MTEPENQQNYFSLWCLMPFLSSPSITAPTILVSKFTNIHGDCFELMFESIQKYGSLTEIFLNLFADQTVVESG